MILAELRDRRKVGIAVLAVVTSVGIAAAVQRSLWLKLTLRGLLVKVGLLKSRSAASGAPWPQDQWIDTRSVEEPLEPEIEIIDAHHHLWDPTQHPKWPGVGPEVFAAWYAVAAPEEINEAVKQDHISKGNQRVLNAFGRRQLPFIQPYMAKELLFDIGNRGSGKAGHKVVQTVYIESGWQPPSVLNEALRVLGEVEMAEGVHAENPTLCNGIVGEADLRRDDVETLLAAYAKRPDVKGVRHSLAWSSDPEIMGHADMADENTASSASFRKGFALLNKYKLTYDTWMFHEQIPGITDLARSFPDQVIIVDHVAEPLGIGKFTREGTFPVWERGMRELAKASKNVYVKLSGLAMCRTGFGYDQLPAPPSSDLLAKDWGPYFRVALDAFGVERCIFASNFPVDKVSTDYTVQWNAYKKIVKDYTPEQKKLLFYGNAKRVYRL